MELETKVEKKKKRCIRVLHGEAKRKNRTKLYDIWNGIKQRSGDPNNKTYQKRGPVEVYDKWRNYAIFRAWAVKNGYKKGMSISRKDHDKGFFPENCEIISNKINASKGDDNPTKRKLSTIDVDEIRSSNSPMADLSKSYDVCISTIFNVIHHRTYKVPYEINN